MKKFALFFLLLCLNLRAQVDGQKYWILTQRLPIWAYKAFTNSKLDETYLISDYINPFYLEADFNGDNQLDITIAIIHKLTKQKGILIIHQKLNQTFILGAGTIFSNAGENFDWMDIWYIERGSNADILIGDNYEKNKLTKKKPKLFVGKSESASGYIYWNEEKYNWTQASD